MNDSFVHRACDRWPGRILVAVAVMLVALGFPRADGARSQQRLCPAHSI